jgi:hypothetical protein
MKYWGHGPILLIKMMCFEKIFEADIIVRKTGPWSNK